MVAQTENSLHKFTGSKWHETRDAWQAYARVLAKIRRTLTKPQKHWWHAALLPVLNGFSTGTLQKETEYFEIQLDLFTSTLHIWFRGEMEQRIPITGQSSQTLLEQINSLCETRKLHFELASDQVSKNAYVNFSATYSRQLGDVFNFINHSFTTVRNEQRQETGPVLLWAHHFDIAFLWFSGRLIPENDPSDAEHSDEQMNIGFVLGDASISEPYFYITAYPWQESFKDTALPHGAYWNKEGFNGAILSWSDLLSQKEPQKYLRKFCELLLQTGKTLMT